jgi:hypothetical protein
MKLYFNQHQNQKKKGMKLKVNIMVFYRLEKEDEKANKRNKTR